MTRRTGATADNEQFYLAMLTQFRDAGIATSGFDGSEPLSLTRPQFFGATISDANGLFYNSSERNY